MLKSVELEQNKKRKMLVKAWFNKNMICLFLFMKGDMR